MVEVLLSINDHDHSGHNQARNYGDFQHVWLYVPFTNSDLHSSLSSFFAPVDLAGGKTSASRGRGSGTTFVLVSFVSIFPL